MNSVRFGEKFLSSQIVGLFPEFVAQVFEEFSVYGNPEFQWL